MKAPRLLLSSIECLISSPVEHSDKLLWSRTYLALFCEDFKQSEFQHFEC